MSFAWFVAGIAFGAVTMFAWSLKAVYDAEMHEHEANARAMIAERKVLDADEIACKSCDSMYDVWKEGRSK